MIKLVIAALSAALCVCAAGQNVTNVEETGATYIGATRLVGKFDGETATMSYFAEYGLTIGTYDDNPSVVETAVVVKTFSTKGHWVDINPGSKLILKVNGENMVLTTPKELGMSVRTTLLWLLRAYSAQFPALRPNSAPQPQPTLYLERIWRSCCNMVSRSFVSKL